MFKCNYHIEQEQAIQEGKAKRLCTRLHWSDSSEESQELHVPGSAHLRWSIPGSAHQGNHKESPPTSLLPQKSACRWILCQTSPSLRWRTYWLVVPRPGWEIWTFRDEGSWRKWWTLPGSSEVLTSSPSKRSTVNTVSWGQQTHISLARLFTLLWLGRRYRSLRTATSMFIEQLLPINYQPEQKPDLSTKSLRTWHYDSCSTYFALSAIVVWFTLNNRSFFFFFVSGERFKRDLGQLVHWEGSRYPERAARGSYTSGYNYTFFKRHLDK